MSTPSKRAKDNITAIVALLVFGAGFVALFADFDYFYLIWILGWAVLVPIVAILFDGDESEWDPFQDHWEWDNWMGSGTQTQTSDESDGALNEESTTDALSALRERYANGDLTDEQFERKLDRLLETETPEDAVEWRERTRHEVERESNR